MLIRSDLLRTFALAVAYALAFLLVFGLLGGWILAGRMLAPLARITEATRMAANGSLAHRIEMEGREDEFRELADAFDAMLARLEAHVAEQRRFAANASHELRTPLAIAESSRCRPQRSEPRHRRTHRPPKTVPAGHNAYAPTMQVWASAWQSSKASPKHTPGPSPSPRAPLAASMSRCSYLRSMSNILVRGTVSLDDRARGPAVDDGGRPRAATAEHG